MSMTSIYQEIRSSEDITLCMETLEPDKPDEITLNNIDHQRRLCKELEFKLTILEFQMFKDLEEISRIKEEFELCKELRDDPAPTPDGSPSEYQW